MFLVADTFFGILPDYLSDIVRLLVGISVAAMAARGAAGLSEKLRREQPNRSAAMRLLGIGAIISFTGWGLYGVSRYVLGIRMGSGWVDWFDVASSLMVASSLAVLALSWSVAGRLRVLLDSTIASSSIAVLSWYFIIAGLWHSASGGTVTRLISVIEPTTDTVLVFMAIVVMICAGGVRRLTASVGLLTSGAMAIGLGALSVHLAKSFEVVNTVQPGRYMLPLGWLLVGIATRVWSVRAEAAQDHRDELRTRALKDSPLSAAGPYAIAVAAFSLVAFQELSRRGAVSGGVFFLTGLLMTLVVVRQLVTLHENQSLTQKVSAFNDDLEKMVELRTSQLNMLYSFSKSIGNSIDIESVIRVANEHIGSAFKAKSTILNLTHFAFATSANTKPMVRESGMEGHEWVLEQLDILDKKWSGSFGTLHDVSFTSHIRYLVAPVLYKTKNFGWIAAFREEGMFDESDVAVLEGLAKEVGTALENARLYELAKQMADIDSVSGLLNHRAAQERFEFAFGYAKETGESLSILMIDVNNFKFFNDTYGHLAGDHVLKSIAKVLRDCVRPHDVLARYGGDEFMILMPGATVADAAKIAQEVEARVKKEGYPEPDSDRVIPYSVSVGYGSYPEEATTRHELLSLADRSMYKAKRAAQGGAPTPVRRTMRAETPTEGFDMLDSMITAIDNKDYYTRAHSEEVTEYALWIAQELRLSEEAQRTIRLAGLLHDVGKIGIPDEILRKPGHLTDEEFVVMRQHPEVGAFMVGNIPGLADIVPGVKYHHERWDGKGYPEKLSGEGIPLLARILAVPDAFSAMTTDRPYRKGLDWQIALDRIRQESGTAFDPTIVEAFQKAIARRRYRQPTAVAA